MSHESNTALWERLEEYFEEKFGRPASQEEIQDAWDTLEEGE